MQYLLAIPKNQQGSWSQSALNLFGGCLGALSYSPTEPQERLGYCFMPLATRLYNIYCTNGLWLCKLGGCFGIMGTEVLQVHYISHKYLHGMEK